MSKRIIQTNNNKSYGTMGTQTEGRTTCGSNVNLGDIVSYTKKDFIAKGVVVEVDGKVGVMGSHINGILGLENLQVIIRSGFVTQELIQHLHGTYLSISEPKKMTLNDIEDKLGYYIELVEG